MTTLWTHCDLILLKFNGISYTIIFFYSKGHFLINVLVYTQFGFKASIMGTKLVGGSKGVDKLGGVVLKV